LVRRDAATRAETEGRNCIALSRSISAGTFDAQGRAGELADAAACPRNAVDELHQRVAVATGQPVETIAADFRCGRVMNAEEATAYGLVDEVVHRHGLRTV
jgi:ATP-dependent Clp protease protease subunit